MSETCSLVPGCDGARDAFLLPWRALDLAPAKGLVRHPVDLAQPDHAAARGQPPTQPVAVLAKLCPRGVAW